MHPNCIFEGCHEPAAKVRGLKANVPGIGQIPVEAALCAKHDDALMNTLLAGFSMEVTP